jgi:hypothetical protein
VVRIVLGVLGVVREQEPRVRHESKRCADDGAVALDKTVRLELSRIDRELIGTYRLTEYEELDEDRAGVRRCEAPDIEGYRLRIRSRAERCGNRSLVEPFGLKPAPQFLHVAILASRHVPGKML